MFRDKENIDAIAKRIAVEIQNIDTDYRGYLLARVGCELINWGQGATARFIMGAARAYGISTPPRSDKPGDSKRGYGRS